MKRRLFLQFYLTIIASLMLVVGSAGLMWRVVQNTSPARSAFDFAGELAGAVLPPASASQGEQQAALNKFASTLHTDLALYGADQVPIAAAGNALPAPQDWRDSGGWVRARGGHAWSIALPDGRWLVMRGKYGDPGPHPAFGLVGVLGGIALAVAIGAYPIARRLSRRLERLQTAVVSLGAGDLTTRVNVEGRDEIASLAQSFNRAAERIQALVGAHRMLLANASHELRTPLSRIRLGVELLKQGGDEARAADVARDIAELDQMVDEILLSSRLDVIDKIEPTEAIDLLGLAAEECSRYAGCTLDGRPVMMHGDARLIRRLIRNLLDNAVRHGAPPIEVTVDAESSGSAIIIVADHGTGIAPAQQGHLFEPFSRTSQRSPSGGTGLGLTIVRQIARRHGGDAVYETTGPTGSQFRVTLQREMPPLR